jgi:hypothetical protein
MFINGQDATTDSGVGFGSGPLRTAFPKSLALIADRNLNIVFSATRQPLNTVGAFVPHSEAQRHAPQVVSDSGKLAESIYASFFRATSGNSNASLGHREAKERDCMGPHTQKPQPLAAAVVNRVHALQDAKLSRCASRALPEPPRPLRELVREERQPARLGIDQPTTITSLSIAPCCERNGDQHAQCLLLGATSASTRTASFCSDVNRDRELNQIFDEAPQAAH